MGGRTTATAGSEWAISSPNALSTAAGAAAFRSGGNAVDAALATAASLVVTSPDNCSLGGDLIALLRDPSGETIVINASGPAPLAVDVEAIQAKHGAAMPVVGPETVTVPGLIAGWEALWSRGAGLPWRQVFREAIAQAREGVPVTASVADALRREAHHVGADPGLRAIFSRDGQHLGRGDALIQTRMASTLTVLAEAGASAFYDGELGSSVLRTLSRLGGSLRQLDLASFQPEISEPLSSVSAGQEVLTAPPNSQGVMLLMILGLLAREDPVLDPLSVDAPVFAEAFHAASDARDRHLADPRFAEIPVDQLLDPPVADAATRRADGSERRGLAPDRGDTVAVVTADDEGRAVCLIQSLFNSFGAGILDPETGIIVHNRGSFFSLDPSSPNVLEPGKRPAHTLTPVLIEEDGELRAVLGTMGGLAQAQILTQIIQHLRRGKPGAAAVAAPRWLVGGLEVTSPRDQVLAEADVPEVALEALAEAGWLLQELPEAALAAGEAQLITREPDDSFVAACDPRSGGAGAAG